MSSFDRPDLCVRSNPSQALREFEGNSLKDSSNWSNGSEDASSLGPILMIAEIWPPVAIVLRYSSCSREGGVSLIIIIVINILWYYTYIDIAIFSAFVKIIIQQYPGMLFCTKDPTSTSTCFSSRSRYRTNSTYQDLYNTHILSLLALY